MMLETGQVAVVTGAASGIGRALAEAFAARGLTVIAVDVETQALAAAVSEMTAAGLAVTGHVVDVRQAEGLELLAVEVIDRHGRVDVLCNNAGVVTPRLPVWQQSFGDLRWTTEVNLYGVHNGIRAFVPQMVAAGRGHVVNTASLAGVSTIPGGGNGVYSASKHAVVGLSETLAVELAGVAPEVGVTVLCPGPVPSRIHDAARNRPHDLGPAAIAAPPGQPNFGLALESIPATRVARQVLAAIEDRRMYLVTSPDIAAMARDRVETLLAQL